MMKRLHIPRALLFICDIQVILRVVDDLVSSSAVSLLWMSIGSISTSFTSEGCRDFISSS